MEGLLSMGPTPSSIDYSYLIHVLVYALSALDLCLVFLGFFLLEFIQNTKNTFKNINN